MTGYKQTCPAFIKLDNKLPFALEADVISIL